MAPPFPCAQFEVDYPIYAVDFDPQDANKLVIGGGGGAGRSGVGNKITILDTSRHDEIRIAGQADLSRDEDTVMSLAVAASHKGKTTHVFAGINSSASDIAKGKNEHLRIFSVEPARAKPLSASLPASATTPTKLPRAFPEVKISETSRTALFANPDQSTYQRLLRVCGTMGAAASALGKEPEVAVFEATAPNPRVRGVLELAKEAEALDVIQTGVNDFQLAFCHRYELYTVQIGAAANSEPKLVFSMPDDHGERPHFRSIRYLTPEFILAVSNLPKKNTGALIQGLRLPSGDRHEKARLAVNARIPGRFSATSLAVANLSPPASPADAVGDTQFVVAVAGNNSSIFLYTLEHQVSSTLSLLTKLYAFYTLQRVHGQEQISGLALSTFVTPKTHIRAQFIKLASTSLQKSIVVHNIPLRKLADAPRARNKRGPLGPPRPIRYVVAMRSRGPSAQPLLISLAVIVLLLAMVGQAIREMYGVGEPVLFAQRFLPSWHGSMRHSDSQLVRLFEEKLASLAGDKLVGAGEKLVLLGPATSSADTDTDTDTDGDAAPGESVQVDVHDAQSHGPGRQWDQLGVDEQLAWKERLREAGAWTQSMGESVFKGVLFGELAGMVGRAVAG
ncbi:hypothetical protein E4U42_004398 [Claviceps africana]|uniref:Guanine nucleotide-exchange factor SEC12 n=1 Tax=Claviceps africana TaxID=83212 RepID=A0A8K0J5Y4_9HYPO|nr:hypothetical protein E4U42_004398 [Claviceps africana]